MHVVIRTGDEAGRSFLVDRELSVGRSPANDIALSDGDVSGRHALVRPTDGAVQVEDIGSRNGTSVNGTRISAPVLVRPGDDLRFADIQVVIEAGTATGEPIAAPHTLVVRAGPDSGRSIQLADGVDILVGRDPTAGLPLTDPRSSSRHARVRMSGDEVVVEDLGSANGTLVDGTRVDGTARVHDRGEIQVGESVLVYYRDGLPSGGYEPTPTIIGVIPSREVDAVARRGRSKKTPYALAAIGVVALGAAAVAVAALLVTGGDDDDDGNVDIPELVDGARAQTVQIINIFDNGSGAVGTGSVVDAEEGLILTNNHVATGGELKVLNELYSRPVDAILIAAAPCDDLALVQVRREGDRDELEEVTFGDDKDLRQGQLVIALGFPNSAESGGGNRLDTLSATSGIISKTDTTYDVPGSGVPRLPRAIQHQAAVNPGNSGGPLFDNMGRQIGVNTAIFVTDRGRAEGENYAVSVRRVRELLEEMKDGESPKWIGASFDQLQTDAGAHTGLAIGGITPGSPADMAGLEPASSPTQWENAIVGIDGDDIETLHDYCQLMPDDGEVTLQVLDRSSGEVNDVEVEVGNTES